MEVNELHENISKLFDKLYHLKELIDFESETLKVTFDTLIAKEILYLNSFSKLVRITELAYKL